MQSLHLARNSAHGVVRTGTRLVLLALVLTLPSLARAQGSESPSDAAATGAASSLTDGSEADSSVTTPPEPELPAVTAQVVDQYIVAAPRVRRWQEVERDTLQHVERSRHIGRRDRMLRALDDRRKEFEESLGMKLAYFQRIEEAIFAVHRARLVVQQQEFEMIRADAALKLAQVRRDRTAIAAARDRHAAAAARLERLRVRYGGYPAEARAPVEAHFQELEKLLGGPDREPSGERIPPWAVQPGASSGK